MENNKDISAKDTKDIFQDDSVFNHFVSLKVEKLSAAVYMVTDFLSDNEPLKWKLRSRAIDHVSEPKTLLRDRKNFYGSVGLDRSLAIVNEIVSLLDIAYLGGTVSRMNFEILKQEYLGLAEAIMGRSQDGSFKRFISDQNISGRNTLTSGWPTGGEVSGRVQTGSAIQYPRNNNLSSDARKLGNNGYIGHKDNQRDNANDLYGLNKKTEKKSLRQEQVVSFLKDKGWTGINDIAKAIEGCGSKTIQRELLSLVSRGILKKQGERRWSRYMLS